MQDEEARSIAARLTKRASQPGAAVAAADVNLGRGELDAAMELSLSAAKRSMITYLPTPDYDPLRSHPRYAELLRALGLHDQPIAQWKGRAPVSSR